MAANVKLTDLGEVLCETRHEGGEWIVFYDDPDNPNSGRGLARFSSIFGAGLGCTKPKDVLTALATDFRKRGYTGSLKNTKPTYVKKHGVQA